MAHLFSNEFKALGKHVASGAFFFSNISYWFEAGYFDTDARLKPLLHLWSLAVEEQFYIIWPLIIFFLVRKKLNILTSITLILILSFVANIYGIYNDYASATYYLPFTRGWELMFGAWLSIYHKNKREQLSKIGDLSLQNTSDHSEVSFENSSSSTNINSSHERATSLSRSHKKEELKDNIKNQKDSLDLLGPFSLLLGFSKNGLILSILSNPNLKSYLGFILIILGFIFIKPNEFFPGFWALLPVLGTTLLIDAGMSAKLNRKYFSQKWAVYIGLISYPLYLWHWIFLSLVFVYFEGNEPPFKRKAKLISIVLTFVFSYLTYQFFEKPIRYSKNKLTPIYLLISIIILGSLGSIIYSKNGFPDRNFVLYQKRHEKIYASMREHAKFKHCTENTFSRYNWCYVGDPSATKEILLMGDSHAGSMIPALDTFGKKHHYKIKVTSQSRSLLLLGVYTHNHEGDLISDAIRDFLDPNNLDNVVGAIFVQVWRLYIGDFSKMDSIAKISPDKNTKPLLDFEFRDSTFKQGINKTLTRLKERNIPTFFIKENPEQKVKPLSAFNRFSNSSSDELFKDAYVTLKEHQELNEKSNEILENATRPFDNAYILDLDQAVCFEGICPAFNQYILYYDQNHLSYDAIMMIYPLLEKKLLEVLNKN